MPQNIDPNFRVSRMATVGYRPNLGFPVRWQDDVSGEMTVAVLALLDFALHRTPELSTAQLELVRDYCQYYVYAPCWEIDNAPEELAELRERIASIRKFDELNKWIHDCLDIGLDPL